MIETYLGLGANLGDREANLERAVVALARLGRVSRSRWYETEPVGLPGAPSFLNGAVKLETDLVPEALLVETRGIERELGRDPTRRSGSRAIDVDILLFGPQVVKRAGLEIPHPRLHLRAFVLVPLVEIAPALVHPVFGQTMAELLAVVGTSGVKAA
jgi:2-amino-4-hydroxy-6-hydroxymethyldihydropteridine diphosphokinase